MVSINLFNYVVYKLVEVVFTLDSDTEVPDVIEPVYPMVVDL